MEHFVIGYILIFLELQQTSLVCCTLGTHLSEDVVVVVVVVVVIIIIIIIIIVIIIIIISCNWVVTRWQWLFYMYIKYEIGY